ncbi:peptide-methionine (S)-S-oxide reductase MsrA [SAR86 cluster bacterium]|nr:peptide-methionine (S)-S-oxide reductase MsrA [SAR86 cluster bacterium]
MSIFSFRNKSELIEKADALPGREEPIFIPDLHYVNGNSLEEIKNRDLDSIIFGMGCFWGAEKFFWELKGIEYTSVGYISGYTANATYEEVCSGMTGHNEVVEVIYSPAEISLEMILKTFWENHDPTQGMRQGNDIGTQYRSGIYFLNEPNLITIEESKNKYQKKLTEKNHGLISTEIIPATTYYYAEEYHQQYLAKNPNGYCGHGGCGISLDD